MVLLVALLSGPFHCMGMLGHGQPWGMGSGLKGIKSLKTVWDCSQGQFALSKGK